MIAKRFDKSIEEDEYYRFSKLTKEKNKIAKVSNRKILDLGIGDPSTFPPFEVLEEIKKSMNIEESHGYSDNGIIDFRYKVANHIGVDYKCINHTMGTKEALCIIALMYINKNDYLITLNPGYNVLSNMCKWLNGKVYNLALKEENNYEVDFNIPKNILKKTKLMYLNYPNNPTGKIASKELYLKAIELAKKYNFKIINDNAYGDLIYDKKDIVNFRDIEGFYNVGIELYSFSKGYNMTGYRIGYILSDEKTIRIFQNVKDNIDSGQYIPIQRGAMKALDSLKFLENNKNKYYRRQVRLHKLLSNFGFNYELPKAGFFAYMKAPRYIDGVYMSSAYKCSMYLLRRYQINVIPYDEYGSYIRMSLTFKEDEDTFFKELENRIKTMKIEF